jgi:protoporphyrinogen oxidase
MSRIAVLGCGWSGLVLSIRLKKLYPEVDVICVDRNFEGGLLKSINISGYLFDAGGSHVVFSRSREVLEGIFSLGGDWVSRERMSYVFFDGTFVPYPFENGLYVFSPEKRARYGYSLIKALAEYHDEKPKNFKEWIYRTFGKEVAEDYLVPYNEKIWKRPLEQLSADWVYTPGRLPLPSLEDIVKTVAGIPTVGYKEQSIFYYPRKGGIFKQWESAYVTAKTLGVTFLREDVRKVKNISGEYVLNGWLRADRVLSTLPLVEAPNIFDLSEEAFRTSDKLEYNSVVVVGLGLRREAPKQHWVYVPDKKIIFHRYAWISNYGEDTPPDRATLIAEVTIPRGEKIDLDEVRAKVMSGLVELGVVREDDIEVAEGWIHKYGYPIYTLAHSKDVGIIFEELRDMGILTFGRWGSWEYWNTDKIYQKSLELDFKIYNSHNSV